MSLRERVIAAMAASIQQTPIYRDQDAYRETDYRKLAAWAFDAALGTGLLQLVGVSSDFDIDELMKEGDEENARLVRDLASSVRRIEMLQAVVSKLGNRAIAAEIRVEQLTEEVKAGDVMLDDLTDANDRQAARIQFFRDMSLSAIGHMTRLMNDELKPSERPGVWAEARDFLRQAVQPPGASVGVREPPE